MLRPIKVEAIVIPRLVSVFFMAVNLLRRLILNNE